jgi:hypothetical protein
MQTMHLYTIYYRVRDAKIDFLKTRGVVYKNLD